MLLRRTLLLAALACAALPALTSAQGVPPGPLRGTITDVRPDGITVRAYGQDVPVLVPEGTSLTWILPAKLADIRPGSYVGTAAMPQSDGTLMAMEVQVFPEAMRGVGAGHRPWNLQPGSSMTNGTVGTVTVANGRTMTIGYPGGKETVFVPPQAPVVTYAPADRSALTVGAHVLAFATKGTDGTLTARFVSIGKDGLVPPM